jgi:carbon monoxide dehydrogenase subunit G
MKLENDFEVPATIDDVWPYLLDVEKVVVCMPGAKLTETVDDDHYKGQLTLKLGPVKLTFAGKVDVEQRDETDHRMVLKGKGTEQKGKGAAQATITVVLSEIGSGGTKIAVEQDLQVSGQAAQLSRGMMQDVSSKLTRQFAECLKSNIEAEDESRQDAAPAGAVPTGAGRGADGGPVAAGASSDASSQTRAPGTQRVTQTAPDEISVASVGFGAVWAAIKRFFGKLTGRNRKS